MRGVLQGASVRERPLLRGMLRPGFPRGAKRAVITGVSVCPPLLHRIMLSQAAAKSLLLLTTAAALVVAQPQGSSCPCAQCMDSNPCAPPACEVCGPGPCASRYGCATNQSAACPCTRSWPSGRGCNYSATSFVYWVESNGGCCQMPAAWMTEPHDNGGNRVAPLPFPASSTSWGSACQYDEIPQSARFTTGTCAEAGFAKQNGQCGSANCDCSTSWYSEQAQCARIMADFCGNAKRSSAGNCFICCGQHQQTLQRSGCTEADISAFCQP